MKDLTKFTKQIIMLSQFGLSIIMPLLLSLFLSWLCVEKLHWGGWIYIPGFFFGLGGSAMTAWKMYLSVQKDLEKQSKDKKIAFNDHD